MKYHDTNLKSNGNYKEFGKFAIHMKFLYENTLLIKYKKSYAPIPQIRKTKISDDFRDAMIMLIDTEKIDYEKAINASNSTERPFLCSAPKVQKIDEEIVELYVSANTTYNGPNFFRAPQHVSQLDNGKYVYVVK